jgi:threonylcarbamoyladenosine tRNA methylthiotransferase MtaB
MMVIDPEAKKDHYLHFFKFQQNLEIPISFTKALHMTTENPKPKTQNLLFHISTFGCKVNQCDSAGMARDLADRGWSLAAPGAVPDLVLVNTCSVTARADQQARQTIRRLAREHPGVPLWVTGCYAQRVPEEVAALPQVAAVLGNRDKVRLGELLSASPTFQGGGIWVEAFTAAVPFQPWRVHAVPGHTRAWLKIQEGCSHHCRYCIVPQVRGPRRSLEPAAVLAAFQELAFLGYREVVLTGVDLGQYGLEQSPAGSLARLVRHLREHAWPFRVRLSSLEPQMVTRELLEALAAWRDFCPHFHLPLQSGAAPVLAAMGRPYGPGEFRDLVQEMARRFPGAGLGLDVLVGFPGEREADFTATRDLVAGLPVSYLHVFPFSPRPNTPATELPPLPGRVIQDRSRIMRELGQAKQAHFLEAQRGQVREVLVEGPGPRKGWLQGLSDHYLRVIFPGPLTWHNRLVKVRLLTRQGKMMVGEAVSET